MPIELIEHNPLLKGPLLEVLRLVEKNPLAPRTEIEDSADFSNIASSLKQTPATIVDILLRNEALEESVYVNGELYELSMQDIQTDESVDDDAEIEQYLSLTDIGSELIDEYGGNKKLYELLADKPQYADVYIKMIETCNDPSGCSRSDLEQAINTLPPLMPDPATGIKAIYPQYFIDSLETAGGIVWRDSWYTTDAGRELITNKEAKQEEELK